jgi:Leucine-rich repeat (LRR) protein
MLIQLTQIPTLEILDLSKNKITTFPESPGLLNRLKVLSLSKNRLYTLPTYLVDFKHLRVLKVDGNPIEWPVSVQCLMKLISSAPGGPRFDDGGR